MNTTRLIISELANPRLSKAFVCVKRRKIFLLPYPLLLVSYTNTRYSMQSFEARCSSVFREYRSETSGAPNENIVQNHLT